MNTIVYSLSKNYFVTHTARGFEVTSPYGYSGSFKTLAEAAKELQRLCTGNP